MPDVPEDDTVGNGVLEGVSSAAISSRAVAVGTLVLVGVDRGVSVASGVVVGVEVGLDVGAAVGGAVVGASVGSTVVGGTEVGVG